MRQHHTAVVGLHVWLSASASLLLLRLANERAGHASWSLQQQEADSWCADSLVTLLASIHLSGYFIGLLLDAHPRWRPFAQGPQLPSVGRGGGARGALLCERVG